MLNPRQCFDSAPIPFPFNCVSVNVKYPEFRLAFPADSQVPHRPWALSVRASPEMATRTASHAGSWYSSSASALTLQLNNFLSEAFPSESSPNSYPPLPITGCRAIISPHAGFTYSGPTAAWAYRCLDLSKAKRIFILHPSHHHHLSTGALPTVTKGYDTPLSRTPLPLDLETINHLSTLSASIPASSRSVKFTTMSRSVDEAEHSCEMQLPFLHRLLQEQYSGKSESSYPPLIPIMIGSTSPPVEKALGVMLAPYVADPSNVFIISSDFCHWGRRFGYTNYTKHAPSPPISQDDLPNSFTPPSTANTNPPHLDTFLSSGTHLSPSWKPPKPSSQPQIYESISHVDHACMSAIATGSHASFLDILARTGNTVCGRHPIGVFLAAVEEVERQTGEKEGEEVQDGAGEETRLKRRFRFVRYTRNEDVTSPQDSSVSYVSAFMVL